MEYPREKFASEEEWIFSWWLNELIEAGFIVEVEYQPEPFQLSESVVASAKMLKKNKVQVVEKKVFAEHIYTPDWRIMWSQTAIGVFVTSLNDIADKENNVYFYNCKMGIGWPESIIDIKGSFNGMNNSSATTFPLNQKWVYSKYGIYVQKVIPLYYTKTKQGKRIPHGLFADTFTPNRYLVQNERINVRRTIHYEPRTLQEYLKLRTCHGNL